MMGEGCKAQLRQMPWRGLCPAAEVGHSASMSPAPGGSDLLKIMHLVSLQTSGSHPNLFLSKAGFSLGHCTLSIRRDGLMWPETRH